MTETEKRVPELRFEDFVEDWEQRKLSDLAKVKTGKAFSSADFNDEGEYLVVTNKNIQDDTNGIKSVGDRIDIFEETILNNYLLNGNNILVTMDGVNIGKTGKYSNEKAVLAQRVGRLNSEQFEFIYQVTNNSKFLSEMNKLSVGNAIKHISLKQISDYSFAAPINEEEQEKIGIFFKQIDDTIALHQRKLTLLKRLKQTYLHGLFPQNHGNKPTLRFAGFPDSWSQSSLGELAKFEKGKGYSKKDLVEYGFRAILYGRLYTKYQTVIETIDTFVESDGGSIHSKIGDVIVPASGESSEDISRASVVPYSGIILGGDINIIEVDKNKLDPIFVALAISHGTQKKELSKLAKGKSIVHLHNSDLKKVILNFPKLEEQKKIGKLVKQLDDTIELQHHKINSIQLLKSTLLDKMFI